VEEPKTAAEPGTLDEEAAKPQGLFIDGDRYDLDGNDLSFKEQRELRKLVRELTGDPEINPADAPMMDFLPALVTIIKRRDDPTFEVDTALELKWDDVIRDLPEDPTPPPAKSGGRRTSAAAGSSS